VKEDKSYETEHNGVVVVVSKVAVPFQELTALGCLLGGPLEEDVIDAIIVFAAELIEADCRYKVQSIVMLVLVFMHACDHVRVSRGCCARQDCLMCWLVSYSGVSRPVYPLPHQYHRGRARWMPLSPSLSPSLRSS
jgi:hypothetical protein